MDQYLGQILLTGFNFAPLGWHFCDGSLLSIAENSALFNLIGTTYGGDGVNSFGLPDLRGRTPMGQGNGPGLSPAIMGQIAGSESVTITSQTYPMHTHTLLGTSDTANGQNPSLAVVANGPTIYRAENPTVVLNNSMCGPAAGQGLPHENRQPYLVCNWIIALEGIYPSQG
jgi:microcystin-dependent protein